MNGDGPFGVPRPRTFPGDIREVIKRDVGVLKRLEIDLSIALTDHCYDLSGNYFYIWSMPDDTSYIDVKINRNSEASLPYIRQTGQETPFEALYITTPAGQAGTCILVYGTEAPELVRMIDNRSASIAGLAQIQAELQGDLTPEDIGTERTIGAVAVLAIAANAGRKSCWLHADINNAGTIYLGCDNTVTTAAGGAVWFACLAAGQGWGIDDYRGDIYAIATAANQLLGTGEF